MLAAVSSIAAGAARQAVGGSLACLASTLHRRGFAASATVDGDTLTVEVGQRRGVQGGPKPPPPLRRR